MTLARWGTHFPDAAHVGPCRWGTHFPDCLYDPTLVTGVGPATSATLALQIEEGAKVTYGFTSPLIKHYDGSEVRGSNTSLPSQSINGVAYLAGSAVLSMRGQLARYAASGAAFLLGLPHESLVLSASSSGTTCFVSSTSYIDWGVPGQRVIVVSGDYLSSVVGVIQSVTSNTIVLDVAPGSVGAIGASIMPAVPVLLDNQQGFSRYRKAGAVELWHINARSIMFGYESGANVVAFKKLSSVTAGALTGATAVFNTPGTSGNLASLQLVSDGAAPSAGTLAVFPTIVNFHFKPNVTTVQNLLDALATTNIRLTGTLPVTSTTLQTANDVFGPAALAGGTDKNWGAMGTGATVTTYQSRAVWDRGIALSGGDTTDDGMTSMAEIVDMGGVPTQIGTATQVDWARKVLIERNGDAERQWLKAFLYAVRGRQKAWWYPTYRADLMAVQLTPGTLKVSSTVGDFFGWYPRLRSYLYLRTATGAEQYIQITAAVDNGDGTISLTITSSDTNYNGGGGGATISTFDLLSWLDLCRFENDQLEVTYVAGAFSFSADARAVQA